MNDLMSKQKFDCIVIGGGPGGYIAAIRAAQRGLATALIEANELGGTCLNRGCIPSKALIANAEVLRKIRKANQFGISVKEVSYNYAEMYARKEEVVKRLRQGLEGVIASNKITVFKGFGKFLSPYEVAVTGEDEALLQGLSFIIATGSEPRSLPTMPFDYERIHDSTSLLNLTTLPKRMLIIGGGVIGCEFACLHNAFGVDVTIVELLPRILSTEGTFISDTMEKALKNQGIKIVTEALVSRLESVASGVRAYLNEGKRLEGDLALVSVGRKYNTDAIGIEKTGVSREKDGSLDTNERMQTNVPHIYAIGDITGKSILAHVASHQGIVAADTIAGLPTAISYLAVPSVIFTHPEVGTVGYTLERAIQAGYQAKIGRFPFQALGKSQASIETEGFAQIVVEKTTGQILGAQVVGYEASSLIAEMAMAIENELTVESIQETIHAHPTIAEAWMEAAFLAGGMPLHLPAKVAM
jgi:dihydrolipoamide dehydrogenase